MKNQIIISLFLLAAFCAAPVFAQKTDKKKQEENPNFSGTWVYDEKKNNKAIKELFKSSKKKSNPNRKQTNKFIIEHIGDEIKVTETVLVENFDDSGKLVDKLEKTFPSKIYYTDKRGEKNVDDKNQSFESITQWKDKKIIVTIFDENKEKYSTITFSLSKDGQELRVVYLNFKSNNGRFSFSAFGDRVFNKEN